MPNGYRVQIQTTEETDRQRESERRRERVRERKKVNNSNWIYILFCGATATATAMQNKNKHHRASCTLRSSHHFSQNMVICRAVSAHAYIILHYIHDEALRFHFHMIVVPSISISMHVLTAQCLCKMMMIPNLFVNIMKINLRRSFNSKTIRLHPSHQ